MSLSFDDAIEFKIQIGHVQETARPNDRKIVSEASDWSAEVVPHPGGFGIAIEHSPRSTTKLWLNDDEAARFSAELQTFIDMAGSRS